MRSNARWGSTRWQCTRIRPAGPRSRPSCPAATAAWPRSCSTCPSSASGLSMTPWPVTACKLPSSRVNAPAAISCPGRFAISACGPATASPSRWMSALWCPETVHLIIEVFLDRHQPNGLAYYTFPSLEAFAELRHAVTTRHGGVSAAPYHTLNLSNGLGDDPLAVDENIRRVCAADVFIHGQWIVAEAVAEIERVVGRSADATVPGGHRVTQLGESLQRREGVVGEAVRLVTVQENLDDKVNSFR